MRTVSKMKDRKASLAFRVIVLVFLIVYAVALMFPYFWAFVSSLKDYDGFKEYTISFIQGFRSENIFESYLISIEKFGKKITMTTGGQRFVGFWEMSWNSLLYAGGGGLCMTFTSCVMAYCCARYKYKFSSFLYILVYFCMIVPVIGSNASEYQVADALGLTESMFGQWIMKCSFLGLNFLLFHASFASMSTDFEQAAEVDGANNYVKFFSISLPLVRNLFGTIFLIAFIGLWSDYTTPLLYLSNSYPTLAVGLYWFSDLSDPEVSTIPVQMATCMLSCIPSLVLFLFFKDKLMSNLSLGGVKG